jgi:hypothetical protein
MRSYAAPFVLLVASLAFGADAPWPTKGDTVYISASFRGLDPPPAIAGAWGHFHMLPCEPVKVVKANPQSSIWVVRDPLGGTERLEGDWASRIHKTEVECKTQFSTQGEPKVTRSGSTFAIRPPS